MRCLTTLSEHKTDEVTNHPILHYQTDEVTNRHLLHYLQIMQHSHWRPSAATSVTLKTMASGTAMSLNIHTGELVLPLLLLSKQWRLVPQCLSTFTLAT